MTLTETEKKRLLGIAQDLIRLESDAMRGQGGIISIPFTGGWGSKRKGRCVTGTEPIS